MNVFSYQLYSSRNFPPLENTLKMLADLGYKSVEAYGALLSETDDPIKLRATLDDLGLTMPTCHIDLGFLQEDPRRAIEIANTVGIKEFYFPYLDEADRPQDADGWKKFASIIDEAGKPLLGAGLVYGWHNHDFEFVTLDDGGLPIDILLDTASSANLEFDVAWAVRAGHDPLSVIEKYGTRISAAHVKDIAPEGQCEDEDGWADVGKGVVDWPTCFAKLKAAGAKHFIMEHDNPSDHERFAKTSISTAKTF